MKTNRYNLPVRFAPETRFELPAEPAAPFRAVVQGELEKLRSRLLLNLLLETNDPEANLLLRHAASEAAALATATGYPLLMLPLLLQEKAEAALTYQRRQARIRSATAPRGKAAA